MYVVFTSDSCEVTSLVSYEGRAFESYVKAEEYSQQCQRAQCALFPVQHLKIEWFEFYQNPWLVVTEDSKGISLLYASPYLHKIEPMVKVLQEQHRSRVIVVKSGDKFELPSQ